MSNVFVFTIDQVASRKAADQVPLLLTELSAIKMLIPFARTIGDEIQGVTESPREAVEITRRVIAPNNWHIGIGIGPLRPAERELRTSTEGTSEVFAVARAAVEAAKKKPGRAQAAVRHVNTAASSAEPELSAHLEALLGLLIGINARRSPSQWAAINAALENPTATQAELAEKLNMTQQGVAKSLAAAMWRQEQDALPLLEYLFRAQQ